METDEVVILRDGGKWERRSKGNRDPPLISSKRCLGRARVAEAAFMRRPKAADVDKLTSGAKREASEAQRPQVSKTRHMQ